MPSPKRTSQLNITTTLQANDRVVVLTNPANTQISNTQTITANSLLLSVAKLITGPYANDSAANAAGIPLNSFYYDATGVVRLRLV